MPFSAFVTSTPVPHTTRRRPHTCSRRAPRAEALPGNPGPPNTGEWSDGASMQKGLQKIEFIIRPNGIVEEHVMGIKGSDCLKITETIEKALGKVVNEEKTSEYYEQEVTVSENITENVSGNNNGGWSGGSQW